MEKNLDSIALVAAPECLELLFPNAASRPSIRWFLELKAQGKIPFRKIGRLIFYDPAEVRRAIDRNSKVEAGE